MKKLLFATAITSIAGVGLCANPPVINGAGASFPAPVYQNWSYTYTKTQAAQVNYQSLGSGAGLNQLKNQTVDFAGSDNPLTLQELEEAQLEQFPMLCGGVVPIVNLPNIKSNQLKLSKETLAGIFLGDITRWDDAKIKADNPKLKLPKMKITVVRRADASGTTFIFTSYLAAISEKWKNQVGAGSAVKWPVGIGGQKNPGVCNNVAKIRGSIGYTEYTYAVEARLTTVTLENQSGKFIEPTVETFAASSANADWENAPGFYMMLINQPGEKSWPITGVTYILIRKDTENNMRQNMMKYFRWCFSTGATAAKKLNYVPLPENTIKLINQKVLK